MGKKMGRPAKLPEQKQGHGPRHLALVPDGDIDIAAIPPPPIRENGEPLCNAALIVWDAYWLSPVSLALDGLEGVDRYTVNRWIRTVDEYETVIKIFKEARVVRGSAKQLAMSPLLGYVMRLETRLDHYSDVLALDPLARARMGITKGEDALTADLVNRRLEGRK